MKISTGIASTTHIDRYGERMTKSALDGMAKQINEKLIPQLIEHDFSQRVGVLLYGEVFQLTDEEHALGYVSGIFENNQEKEEFITGQRNEVWQKYQKYLCIEELLKLNKQNQQIVQSSSTQKDRNLADLLELHLDTTQVLPDGTVYKIKRFIASTGDLRIVIYPKDHNPQHFHVISKQKNIDARFDIQTLDLINTKQGNIQAKDIKKIQNFFKIFPLCLEKMKNEHARMQ
jgi:hypothetical protein